MPTFLNLVVLAVVLLTAALYLRWNGRRKEGGDCKLPLGYSFWSIIGDTYSLLKPQPSNSIGDLVVQRMSKYGKIFTINLIGKPMIVSADPELNRFVLQNEMALFENIWPPAFRNLMGENSMALRTGDAHKQLRSIVISFISAARLRTSFLHEADRLATKLFSSLEDGSVISAVKAVKQYTFDVIVKNVLSMEPGQPETEKLREDFSRLFIGVFYIVPLNLPGTQYNKSVKARHNFLRVIKQCMDQRMNVKGIAGAEEDDLLGWVMKNTRLSIEEIGDLVLGTVFAGSETTSKAIPLVIYFLEGCPRAIEQLREEHHQIVRSRKQGGDSKLTWDDYKQMEFTQCVIMEALRLGNITRFLQKRATTDIQYKGYLIPRGCKVLAHVTAVHLDPSVFEDPELFNPWRWLSSSGIKQTNKFMTFGGGPRLCPGMDLARLEIAVFIHHLILKFNWKAAEHDQPISSPMLEFPKGLPINVRALALEP